ncbi:MAG: VanZ family protein [Planctomycetota bacterium]|nr:VanZ family protein [Planctomycetota bacterium]
MSFLVAIASACRRSPRFVAVILFCVWTGLIFYLSDRPPPDPDAHSGAARAWLMNLRHAPAFGMFGLLFLWATSRSGQRLAASIRRVNWAIVAVLVYGIVDERHQFHTPGRDASVSDILTNLAGGWLCAHVLFAVEEGASGSKVARLFAIGLPACGVAAAIATLIPPLWPELTWL